MAYCICVYSGMPFPMPGDHGPMSFDDRGLPPMPPDMMSHGQCYIYTCIYIHQYFVVWEHVF